LQLTRGNASGRSGMAEVIRRGFRRARLAMVVLERGFYPSCATFSYLPAALRAFVEVRTFSMLDPDLVEGLNEFQPTVLACYANLLARLANDVEAGRLRLNSLRHVVSHSETLTPPVRERLRAIFGVPVLNNYAAAECTYLSNGCPTDPGMHVNADCCIVEVVDEAYRPVPDGTPGAKVLVTNLFNTAQPFIRYEVND